MCSHACTVESNLLVFLVSDGRTVAVKHIQKKHFTLSKTIRKEVKEVRSVVLNAYHFMIFQVGPCGSEWVRTCTRHIIITHYTYVTKYVVICKFGINISFISHFVHSSIDSYKSMFTKWLFSIRELDHPNLAKFIGGSIEVPYICIITEYCPKGSLADVLLNEDIPINWGFR